MTRNTPFVALIGLLTAAWLASPGLAQVGTIPSRGGAPIDATFITQTSNAALSAEQALSALATALMLNQTGTGVVSAYAGTSCTNQFVRALSAVGAATCATVALTDTTGIAASGANADITGLSGLTGNLDIGGSAGVRATGADGVLTVLGLGNGADENLTIDLDNAGANAIAIGSGTGAALVDLSGIDVRARKLGGNGSTPAISDTSADSCGTGAETIAGTDTNGKVTVIGSAGTSCTVTFAVAYQAAPSCFASNETSAQLARATSSTTTVVLAGTFAENDVISYACIGR